MSSQTFLYCQLYWSDLDLYHDGTDVSANRECNVVQKIMSCRVYLQCCLKGGRGDPEAGYSLQSAMLQWLRFRLARALCSCQGNNCKC